MKITQQKLFDSNVLDKKLKDGLGAFLQYVNSAVDMFARCLNKQVTLEDNVKCQLKTVRFSHNVTTQVGTNPGTVEGVVVLSSTEMVTGFKWAYGSSANQLAVTIKTESAIASDVVLCVFFK